MLTTSTSTSTTISTRITIEQIENYGRLSRVAYSQKNIEEARRYARLAMEGSRILKQFQLFQTSSALLCATYSVKGSDMLQAGNNALSEGNKDLAKECYEKAKEIFEAAIKDIEIVAQDWYAKDANILYLIYCCGNSYFSLGRLYIKDDAQRSYVKEQFVSAGKILNETPFIIAMSDNLLEEKFVLHQNVNGLLMLAENLSSSWKDLESSANDGDEKKRCHTEIQQLQELKKDIKSEMDQSISYFHTDESKHSLNEGGKILQKKFDSKMAEQDEQQKKLKIQQKQEREKQEKVYAEQQKRAQDERAKQNKIMRERQKLKRAEQRKKYEEQRKQLDERLRKVEQAKIAKQEKERQEKEKQKQAEQKKEEEEQQKKLEEQRKEREAQREKQRELQKLIRAKRSLEQQERKKTSHDRREEERKERQREKLKGKQTKTEDQQLETKAEQKKEKRPSDETKSKLLSSTNSVGNVNQLQYGEVSILQKNLEEQCKAIAVRQRNTEAEQKKGKEKEKDDSQQKETKLQYGSVSILHTIFGKSLQQQTRCAAVNTSVATTSTSASIEVIQCKQLEQQTFVSKVFSEVQSELRELEARNLGASVLFTGSFAIYVVLEQRESRQIDEQWFFDIDEHITGLTAEQLTSYCNWKNYDLWPHPLLKDHYRLTINKESITDKITRGITRDITLALGESDNDEYYGLNIDKVFIRINAKGELEIRCRYLQDFFLFITKGIIMFVGGSKQDVMEHQPRAILRAIKYKYGKKFPFEVEFDSVLAACFDTPQNKSQTGKFLADRLTTGFIYPGMQDLLLAKINFLDKKINIIEIWDKIFPDLKKYYEKDKSFSEMYNKAFEEAANMPYPCVAKIFSIFLLPQLIEQMPKVSSSAELLEKKRELQCVVDEILDSYSISESKSKQSVGKFMRSSFGAYLDKRQEISNEFCSSSKSQGCFALH